MVKCPNCLKEVPDKKFCENCGYLLKPDSGEVEPKIEKNRIIQKLQESENQVHVGVSNGTKICPVCGREFPSSANFCNSCRGSDGRPVRLVEKSQINKLHIKLIDAATNNYLEFNIYKSKQFGREDFKAWYKNGGILNKDEFIHISRKHFKISEKEDGSIVIVDTNSSNGTYLNDVAMEPSKEYTLETGNEIGFYLGGDRMLKLRAEFANNRR